PHIEPAKGYPTECFDCNFGGGNYRLSLKVERRINYTINPGMFSKRHNQSIKQRVLMLVDGLDPRRAVHVGNPRKALTPFLRDRADRQHIIKHGRGFELEVIMGKPVRHCRGEGPKTFP